MKPGGGTTTKPFRSVLSPFILPAFSFMTACGAADAPPIETGSSSPPAIVADAGPPQSVFLGTFVTLDGSKSTNANQTGLTYAWTLEKPPGSKAALSDPNIVDPTFRPDIEGQYEATLIVTDAQNPNLASTPATVLVMASKTNPPPVANVGKTSLNAFSRTQVLLDGSQSKDPNGDPLTFQWSIAGKPKGSSPDLRDATTVAPAFTPDIDGTYILRLVVHDGTNSSTPASVSIKASPKPSPTAVAGTKLKFFFPLNTSSVTLDGYASHTNPAGGELEYKWSMNSPLNYPITDDTSPLARFSPTPNVATTYVAQLTVTEKNYPGPQSDFDLDTVSVILGPLASVKAYLLTNPTVPILTCTLAACDTATVPVKATLLLDGSDSNVKPLTYFWRITNPETGASLTNQTNEKSTFTADSAAISGTTYSLELEVTDESPAGNKNVRPFNITVKDGPPVAIASSPSQPGVPTKVTVSLSHSSSDPALRYTWEFISRPNQSNAAFKDASPDSPNQANEFTTDVSGDYAVKLTVKDTSTMPNATKFATATIRANNNPTARITVTPDPPHVCSTVELKGTSSSDSDGTVASYSWTLTRPDGSSSVLATTDSATTSFKADKQSSYTATLVVTDNFGASDDAGTEFTPEPNPTGQLIYDTNGLPGMGNKTFNGGTGPSCRACHQANNHDPGPSPSGRNLSGVSFDAIKDKLTGTHIGGTTTLTEETDPKLSSQIKALTEFLESTLEKCP